MPKISTLRNKADKLLQEKNREENPRCEICFKPSQVGHHFFPKSTSSALRYNMENIISLCNGCHMQHHNGDPRIHAEVLRHRGEVWYQALLMNKQEIIKISQTYYKEIIVNLQKNDRKM